MADIKLTSGVDNYLQPLDERWQWNNIYGLEGNDTIRAYQGVVSGGPGNDVIERVVITGERHGLQVAYWDAQDGLRVNLAEGWAEDGLGGRDQLIGVSDVHGGGKTSWIWGDDNDNYYWPNGQTDTFYGAGGNDGISMNSWFRPAQNEPFRQALLADLDIRVSLDGRSAVVTPKGMPDFRMELTDVEYFDVADTLDNGAHWTKYYFADFIRQQDMAEQAIAAGGDLRWNAGQALGSAVQVSYSFVTKAPISGTGAPSFRAFTAAEQQLVRDILAQTAALAGISFVEVSETGSEVGQLRFGVSSQGATKGVSWLPNQTGAADQAGDVWMDTDSMRDLTRGSEGYAALLHEIGHALGLRHPRNSDKADAWTAQLREGDDRSSLSAMSGNASADGLFRGDWGVLDVLALRYLYGTRSFHAGDDVYRLTPEDAARQLTVVDDGGQDTIDASALGAGVNLDLVGGHLSSVGLSAAGFAAVDNLGLPTTTQIENAVGSALDDVLLGNAADNRLTGGLGNDWIDGAAGTDTAVFAGERAAYEVSTGFGKTFVRARDGVGGFDTLLNIERLQFADQVVTLSAKGLGADVSLAIDEDTPLATLLPAPTDVERSGARYVLAAQPAHGKATLGTNGQLSYTPSSNYWGTDAIAFDVQVGGGANRYVAYVDIRPINDAAPVAKNASFLVAAGALATRHLPAAADVDGDAVTYSLAANASQGRVTLSSNGEFIYQSNGTQAGQDSFAFVVSDGMGGANTYTATIDLAGMTALQLGTSGSDNLGAAASGDGYSLGAGDDRATGGGGDDLIDGGSGLDLAIYSGNRSNYSVSNASSHWAVVDRRGTDGSDRLVGVERLQFKDGNLAFDLDGHAGEAAQVIRALFGAATLKVPLYVGHALRMLDAGMSEAELVSVALSIPEFWAQMPTHGNRDFVNVVYKNVTGSAPDAGTLGALTALLDSGAFTQASLGLLAAQHAWNTGSADLVGLASTGLAYTPISG